MAARRYTNAAQIEALIDSTRNEARELLVRAESLEMTAALLVKVPEFVEEARKKREEAEHGRTRAALLINRSLPKLSAKLATFNTQPMPGIIDGSVPVK